MDKPLLSSRDVDDEPLVWNKKTGTAFSLFLSSLKWILKIVIWLLLITWVAFIFLYPLNSVSQSITKWNDDTSATFLGSAGVVFLIYSCPILIIALLSVPYLIISAKERQLHEKKMSSSTPKRPSYRLSTFARFANEAVGVVSCAEFFGIVVFVFFVIWAVCVYAVHGAELIAESRSSLLQVSGLSFGLIGIFCLSFLFIPIARGSIILRLIDIPFAHATTYHVWLAHLTVLLFTLHGLSYIISWSVQGFPYLLHKILEWNDSGAANLAGIMGYLTFVSIWLTSLPPVRKQYFEVFFYTHQLYITFIILLALHIGVVYFSVVAGTIFLFMLDRFLRFCQSRTTVDIVSATCFPTTEIVELVLSKPPNLQYNALSFIFLRVGEASGFQWHPFSVSSSSLVDEDHLSVIIKAVGGWTTKIKEIISSMCEGEGLQHLEPPSKLITASVEGPYGQEFPHHLMYEDLVLIAGGVGISPFLAVLSDIFHRIGRGKPCLAKNIVVVWAVKRSKEILLLSTIDMKAICPNFPCNVNLDILIYITQESEPPLEEGTIDHKAITCYHAPDHHLSNRSNISVLVATNNTWFGIYLISTTIGFITLMCLLNIFYINPDSIPAGWYQGLLLLACMVSSVLIFGGLVIGLWHVWGRQVSPKMNCELDKKRFEAKHVQHGRHLYRDLVSLSKILYGSRPNFKDIFEYISDQARGHVDVGVIVCGPPSLQSTVAKECRSINAKNDQLDHPILHFHNHSFNL